MSLSQKHGKSKIREGNAPLAAKSQESERRFPVVGIGASAGGFEALNQLLENLPRQTGMAFVLIQHLDPKRDSILSELLARHSKIPVLQAAGEMRVEPDHAYVIPPGANLMISQGVLKLQPRPEHPGANMPIDTFLRSLAKDQGQNALAVILSGTGSDGALALTEIKAQGGLCFAQEPGSATHDGMPYAAISTGHVDFVLRPDEIARELTRVSAHPYLHAAPVEHARGGVEDDYRKILTLVRNATGVDFTSYKQTTIKRRISRRMALLKLDAPAGYVRHLKSTPDEIKALYNDLLINVTSFFRDPDTFEGLQHLIFTKLTKDRTERPIRIWVPACSTGEEVYSIAMRLMEHLAANHTRMPVQIFATDISEVALEKARAGKYIENITVDVSPERLRRFFIKSNGGYQIAKFIREMCVFARQDLTRDPPFSNLDLISCRNVLIYLDTALQKKIMPVFHYALKPGGFLVLGSSESIGVFSDLFESVDKKHRFFSKKPAHGRFMYEFPIKKPWPDKGHDATGSKEAVALNDSELHEQADRLVLSDFAPPGVLINENLEVVQFRGKTSPYLENAAGKPNLSVLKMARNGLLVDLRAAINKAQKDRARVRKEGIQIEGNGHPRVVNIDVVPVQGHHWLILFEDATPAAADERVAAKSKGRRGKSAAETVNRQTGKLKEELSVAKRDLLETKKYLESVIEELEAANEELKSANEEVLSSNEELQSTNEELETSKEELQSTNEELLTVNEESTNRNQELKRANDDLLNLFNAVSIPMLMLSRDLRIRGYTRAAEKVLKVIPTDVGRPIGDIKTSLAVPDLRQMIVEVIDSCAPFEAEVQDAAGRWLRLNILPYKSEDNKIDGAVMSLVDIDVIKRGAASLEEAREFAESIIDTVREPLLVLDGELRVKRANRAFYAIFKTAHEEIERVLVYDLGGKQWNIPKLRSLLEDIVPNNSVITDFSIEHEFEKIGRKTMLLNACRIDAADSSKRSILLSIEDITDRKLREEHERQLFRERAAREEAEAANHSKDAFLATLSHELRTPLSTMLLCAKALQSGNLDAAQSAHALAVVERSVKTQSKLIEDLLDVSRIIAGKLKLDVIPLNLEPIVKTTVESLRPQAEAKNIELHTELRSQQWPVSGDAMRLQQVLSNLLNNAIKFTSSGGRVTVRLETVGREKSRFAKLVVADTGKGISAEFLTHVFERFKQSDTSSTRAHSGLGLGLALVKHLVELHGGSVKAESEGMGKGAAFTVELPLSDLPLERAAGSSALHKSVRIHVTDQPIELSGQKILVVDDDLDICDMLRSLLVQHGAEITTAASAQEAYERIQAVKPGVLISDLAMPGEDGIGLVKRIRALDAKHGGGIKAIALTAHARSEDRERALAAGFNSYLSKPVDLAELLAVIAELTEK